MRKDEFDLDIVSEDIEVVNECLKMEFEQEAVTYKLGKKEFVVQPIYKEETGKPIHESLLNLMQKDNENH